LQAFPDTASKHWNTAVSDGEFIEAATRMGLRERAPSRMIDSIIDAAEAWADRCHEIGFTPRQTELLTKHAGLKDRNLEVIRIAANCVSRI
jgi:hypothetical protein